MEVVSRNVVNKNISPLRNYECYSKVLSFYNKHPSDNITLEEFERFAYDRMRVLKEIEACKVRGLKGTEYHERLERVTKQYLDLSENSIESIRKDVISHHVLRIAYCRPSDRQWLITHECALFRHRLGQHQGSVQTTQEFLTANEMHYAQPTESVWKEVRDDIVDVSSPGEGEGSRANVSRATVYEIPFEQALELVSQRKCVLRRGTAYVRRIDLDSILVARFRAHLSERLAFQFRALPTMLKHFEQIGPLLGNLLKQYVGSGFKPKGQIGQLTLADLDAASERSFPQCMRHMKDMLEYEHKLKHSGRLQYGLFLKAIGISLDDALLYWRTEFTKVMTDKEFESGYAYNIRHNYGKVGKRTDYSPFSCIKIITGAHQAGEHHGCPFAHHSEQQLRASLSKEFQKKQVSGVGAVVDELVALSKQHHYQIACRRHWEATHPQDATKSAELVIHHPNQYFEESEIYWKQQMAHQQLQQQPQVQAIKDKQQQQQQEQQDSQQQDESAPATPTQATPTPTPTPMETN